MDNIQRAVSILLGALMVAYLLINVRTQQTSYDEQPMDIQQEFERFFDKMGYPVVPEEETVDL
jgi:hypothetical protein